MIKKLMFFVFLSSIYNNNYSAPYAAHLSKYISTKVAQKIATGVIGASIIGGVLYYNNADFNQLKELTFQSFDFCKDKVVDFSNACPQVPATIAAFLLLKYGSRLISYHTLSSALILSMVAAPIYFNTYEEFQKAAITNNPETVIKNSYNGFRNSLIGTGNSMINFFKGKWQNKPEINNKPKTLDNILESDDNKDFLTTYKYHLLTGVVGLTLLMIFIKKTFFSNNSAPWSTLNKS